MGRGNEKGTERWIMKGGSRLMAIVITAEGRARSGSAPSPKMGRRKDMIEL